MGDPLTIEARGHANATAAELWRLLEDVTSYKDWGPWSESDYVEQPTSAPHGAGAIRRLRYRKRRSVTIEPVIEAVPERLLVYELRSGVPVRNYRATVELMPASGGTEIRWRASFDRTLGGRLARRTLQRIYGEVIGCLIAAAESRAA